MDYSYFRDTGGEWWWRIHAEDGSIVMDSSGGYSSEQECLEAITRIKGSANGSVLRRQLDAELPASTDTTKEVVTKKKTEKIGTATTKTDSNQQLAAAPPASVETREIATQKKAEDTHTKTEKTGTATAKSDSSSLTPDMTLGDSPVACVFTTTDNQLRWRYKANDGVVPFRLLGAVSEFDSIMATIAVSVPKAYRKETYHQLGKALFAAFHTPEGTRPGSEFRKVRLFVRKKAKERARLSYVLASLAAATVLELVVLPIYFLTPASNLKLVILGGCFGAIGATISVLQRNPSLELDPWMSTRYHALQGVTRIVLGFIFGGTFVIASKANFVLGVIRNNPYPLLILCIVAGFSERLIPELLGKFESTQSTSSRISNDSADG
jgi:uncharacterized protein YegP (UPF0339 family)